MFGPEGTINPVAKLDGIINSGKLTRGEDLVDDFDAEGNQRETRKQRWQYVIDGRPSFEITRPTDFELGNPFGNLRGVTRWTISGGLEIVEGMVVDSHGLAAQSLYPEIAGLSEEERASS